MSRGFPLRVTAQRALVVWGTVVLSELALLSTMSRALDVPIAFFDTALLLAATMLLGTVWALREHLVRRGPSAVIAALVPFAATCLLLTPRLTQGAPSDALLTIGVAAAMTVPLERAWTGWVVRRRPPPIAYGFRIAGPTLAVALVVIAAGRDPITLAGALGSVTFSVLLGLWIARRAYLAEREAVGFSRRVERIEVRDDALIIPEGPRPNDPWLRELDESLRRRSRELAEDARGARQAEAEIDDARQLRSRFMASMSHELRSPLNSIVGFAQLLEDGLDGALGEEQLQSVQLIRGAAEELIILLTDTLDLARLEAGKLRLHKEWVPSVEILTEAVRRGRAFVTGREVEIEAELQPGLPPVFADPRRITQALVALFRHAAASMNRTTVRLRARTALGPPGPAQQLRLEFYDAVGALPTEEVERIFEAFAEIRAPRGRRVGGLGMALSLSRSLVRLHGGEVWADGMPGAGTVLCVALPLDESEEYLVPLDAGSAEP